MNEVLAYLATQVGLLPKKVKKERKYLVTFDGNETWYAYLVRGEKKFKLSRSGKSVVESSNPGLGGGHFSFKEAKEVCRTFEVMQRREEVLREARESRKKELYFTSSNILL